MSEVQICNVGLIALGESTITALTDNVKAARLCNTIYHDKRDALLRSFDWKFAMKRSTLAPDVAVPEYEWDHQFTLPAACLRLLEVYPSYVPYRVEKNKILCNETVLYIKYIYQVTDTTEMDSTFREALSAMIAKELAIPLTDSQRKSEAMEALYEVKLGDARFAGSIEDVNEKLEAEDWLESRL